MAKIILEKAFLNSSLSIVPLKFLAMSSGLFMKTPQPHAPRTRMDALALAETARTLRIRRRITFQITEKSDHFWA